MGKPWWASKTVWMAFAEILGGIVAAAYGGEIVGWVGWTVAVCGAIQAMLRVATTEPLSIRVQSRHPRYK
jgi:ABC-type tungstate transport system substrate-binding protein